MGFGGNIKVKVEVPDIASAAGKAVDTASGLVSGAGNIVSGAVDATRSSVDTATGAISDTVDNASGALNRVAGAIGEVAVSFTGAAEDLVLEPHLQLDANASWGKTAFEKGPIRVRVDLTRMEADNNTDTIRMVSASGNFDEQKQISTYTESGENTVDVMFENAPMNETFSLEILHDGGEIRTVFSGVPYGDLRNMKGRC